MKKLLLLAASLVFITMAGHAQTAPPSTCAQGLQPACTDDQTAVASGAVLTVRNNGATAASFEEVITGTPATVSIAIQGCGTAGTCDTALDTNTTVANAIRSPTITKIYAYYKITITWTGGTAPTVRVVTHETLF